MTEQGFLLIASGVASALIFIGITLLVLPHPSKQPRSRSLAFGIVIFGAGILASLLTSAIFRPTTIPATTIGDPRELTRLLSPLAGTSKIADLCVESILNSDVYYTDFKAHYALRRPEGPQWTEIDKRTYLEVLSDISFRVHNPAHHSIDYQIQQTYFDLVMVKDKPELAAIAFEELSYTLLDHTGVERPGSRVKWDKYSLDVGVTRDSEARRAIFSRTVTIGPGEQVGIHLNTISWALSAQGNISLHSKSKGIGMSMVVTFPDASYDAHVSFSHSDSKLWSVKKDGLQTVASIDGAFLPYNGITVTW